MSENEALQSDKLIKKIDEIQQNLENITLDFTDTTDKQKNERATKLQSLYRGKKARQETGELKDCKTKFEELENFNKDDDDEFEKRLDDLYEKCKSRLELNPPEIRKEYVKKKCNKATTFENIKKINYYDKVNEKYILCENVAQEKYKELEKKRDEEEKRDIEERLQKKRKTKAAKAAALSARKAEATKCRAKIEELVGIYDSIKKETVDITKDGENIYEMFQLIIEIYDSRTFDNLETPGEDSVCSIKQLKKNKGKLSPIIKLLKTIELFQDEKYVTDDDNIYKVIIKNSLQTNDMDKKIVFNVELKDIITEKIETIRLLDLKFDTKTYEEVSEGIIDSTLDRVRTQNLSEEEAAVKIQSIIRGRIVKNKKLIRKKRVKELESELEKKQQPVNCGIFAGPAACENEKGTDGLRKCEYEQPGGPCKEIEGEQRRKFLTYQYNEEQEIKGNKEWKKFLDLKKGESYLPVQNGLSGPLKKIPYNIEYAVHVFEDGYYFDGQYTEKSVLDQKYEAGMLSIDIQWGSKRDDPIKINVNNIYFSTLSGLGLYKNEVIENFQKKAKKARQAAIDKKNDNIPMAEKEILETATEIDNTALEELKKKLAEKQEELEKQIKESQDKKNLNNEEIKKLREQQQQELKQQFDKQREEYNKKLEEAKAAAKKRSDDYKIHRKKHYKNLEKAKAAAEKSEQKIEKLNEQIKNLSKGDAEQKAQLEKKKKEIEKEAKAAEVAKAEAEVKVSEVEQKTKELHEEQINLQKLKSQHEKELEELRNLEKKQKERDEEERRKKMKEFMKHKGESLKESIESLKDEKENFTNMSEIKIAALESYPTLHDKIKKFLVFKEDELIKAHHAKFYSDNIKRNNEKLVETLKLVPSEPFLGIEGLPLVAGFGSNPEQEEKKEEVIILKVVKKKVRDFIMSKAEYIFVPSQHEQLSVKEYLKTL